MLLAMRDGTAVAGIEVPWLDAWPWARSATRRRASCSPAEAPRPDRRRGAPASAPPPATRSRCVELPRCSPTTSAPAASRWRSRCRPGTAVERAFRRELDSLPRRDPPRAAGRHRAHARGSPATGGGAARVRPRSRGARARREGAPLRGSRAARRVPPPAAALRRLPRGVAPPSAAPPHAALAATAPDAGAERAWHLAAGAVAPDEAVARGARGAARRRPRRGAHATAARDFGRAAQLTPGARAACAAAARGGDRRDPLRRADGRAAAVCWARAARWRPTRCCPPSVQRLRPRRAAPRLARWWPASCWWPRRARPPRDPRRAAGMLLEGRRSAT